MDDQNTTFSGQGITAFCDEFPGIEMSIRTSKYYVHMTGGGEEYKIPIQTILRIYSFSKAERDEYYAAFIMLRMLLCIRLFFSAENHRSSFINAVRNEMSKGDYRDLEALNRDNYDTTNRYVYDTEKTFSRYGVSKSGSAWRFSSINANYKLCDTYPSIIVVPKKMKDIILQFGSQFRSKKRIPALTYIYKPNMASMSRSSQPLVGLIGRRSKQDELLVSLMFASNKNKETFSNKDINGIIFDARPSINIRTQKTMGGGTEVRKAYSNCKFDVLNIENIHSVQHSYEFLIEEIEKNHFEGLPTNTKDESRWLEKLRLILEGTKKIVKAIHEDGLNVLIHCSDGWDRTPQLCSLSQICLDPYYRTIEGLGSLVEKEWVSFGHQFSGRCGHLSSTYPETYGPIAHFNYDRVGESGSGEDGLDNRFYSKIDTINSKVRGSLRSFIGSSNCNAAAQGLKDIKSKYLQMLGERHTYVSRTFEYDCEVSNIFPQFLECIYQLLLQFPGEFEYSADLLTELQIAVYSCYYANFLFSCEEEKENYEKLHMDAKGRMLPNIWDYVNDNRGKFLNEKYDPSKCPPEDLGTGANYPPPLYPRTDNLVYWQNDYFKTRKLLDVFKVR